MFTPPPQLQDNERNKYLFLNLSKLIVLEAPKVNLGIDLQNYTTGPNFKGIKLIPPGFHTFYFSVLDKEDNQSLVKFYFFVSQPKQNLVLKYDSSVELFTLNQEIDLELKSRVEFNIYDLDKCLGAYDQTTYDTWASLTSYIFNPFLKQNANYKEGYFFDIEQSLTLFTDLDLNLSLKQVQGNNRTLLSLDKTIQFQTKFPPKKHLHFLGELQFAFVVLLFGFNLSALDQLKKLIQLITQSTQLILLHPKLFLNFLTVLQGILLQFPQDMFLDPILENNFLIKGINELIVNFNSVKQDLQERYQKVLLERFTALQKVIDKRFFHQLDLNLKYEEQEEDLPVMVDL